MNLCNIQPALLFCPFYALFVLLIKGLEMLTSLIVTNGLYALLIGEIKVKFNSHGGDTSCDNEV